MSEGKLYRGKIKPDLVSYLEENFKNFWDYITNMSSKSASYLEQTCPILMDSTQTVNTTRADKDFIASNSVNGVPTGLISEDITRLVSAFILIIGRSVNTFNGQNYLDCSTPTWNQWMLNVDGGVYVDLQNDTKGDGQMLDQDWQCLARGVIHPFTLMYNITGMITSASNRLGLRLANAVSVADSLIVTLDVYAKYTWRL